MQRRSAVEVLSRGSAVPHAPLEVGSQQTTRKRLWRGARVGSYNILLDPRIQGEIQEGLNIQPVPRSKAFCRGLVNLRGNLVAIYDVRQFLGDAGDQQRWHLILHTEPAWVGIGMDELPDQFALDESERVRQLPPLPGGLEPYVKAGYRSGDALWLELDLESFFRQLAEQAVETAA